MCCTCLLLISSSTGQTQYKSLSGHIFSAPPVLKASEKHHGTYCHYFVSSSHYWTYLGRISRVHLHQGGKAYVHVVFQYMNAPYTMMCSCYFPPVSRDDSRTHRIFACILPKAHTCWLPTYLCRDLRSALCVSATRRPIYPPHHQ